jgi:hypothetical protein
LSNLLSGNSAKSGSRILAFPFDVGFVSEAHFSSISTRIALTSRREGVVAWKDSDLDGTPLEYLRTDSSIGLEWPVSDFSTLCRRPKTLGVNIPYRGSHGALHLLIDSTGIKAGR